MLSQCEWPGNMPSLHRNGTNYFAVPAGNSLTCVAEVACDAEARHQEPLGDLCTDVVDDLHHQREGPGDTVENGVAVTCRE